jgi:hypothetical protein
MATKRPDIAAVIDRDIAERAVEKQESEPESDENVRFNIIVPKDAYEKLKLIAKRRGTKAAIMLREYVLQVVQHNPV